MSTTQVTTGYALQLDVEGPGGSVFASWNMYEQMGFTDEIVLSLVQTLKSFPWPAGTTVNVQVNKSTSTNEFFDTHLDVDPPVFS